MEWFVTPISVEEGATVSLTVDGRAVLVGCWEGTWWSIEDRCSHAGCSFTDDGEIIGGVAVCNCHGSEFDLRTGAPLSIPAKDPVDVFPVRIRDGRVEVGMEHEDSANE